MVVAGTGDGAAVGERLRAARAARGMSLRSLAALLGVSPATLSQIENGRTNLSVRRLEQIAAALGMAVAEVLETAAAPLEFPGAEHRRPGPAAASTKEANTLNAAWRHYEPLDFDPVLRAALEEFLVIGYHGATVRTIAARAGLSVSGIYHHYTSKQQMLLTILDLTMSELLARARGAQAEGSNPVQRFCLLIENLALFHTHRRELGFVGAAEMRAFDPHNRERIAALRSTQQRMVDIEVEAAVRDGSFRADHPYEAARAAVTLCTALPTWWRPHGPLTAEQVAEQYVGFALDLMRVAPREVASRGVV